MNVNDLSLGKYYLPSQFFNDNYTYQFRLTSSYTTYFIRVYTGLQPDLTTSCDHNTTNCVFYDIYFHEGNYFFTSNIGRFSNQNQYPLMTSARFTSDMYYRPDFDKICIIFLFLFFFIIFIPYKVFARFFGRWLKV